jgi:predicted MPP superfamily phosphohydrolase
MVTGTTLLGIGSTAMAEDNPMPRVTKQSLAVEGLPRGPLRITVLADLHARSRYSPLSELVGMVQNTRPDILVLAGDILYRAGDEALVEQIGAVDAAAAKVAVLGNWEYQRRLNLRSLRRHYARAGVELLVNQRTEAAGLPIVGLDDLLKGAPDYAACTIPAILRNRRRSSWSVTAPAIFRRVCRAAPGRVVMLAGHTHGGQIAPFGRVLVTPQGSGPYVHGWYRKGIHHLYVSRGIGTSGIPLRIGAPPEIVVLDLVSA